MPTSEDPIAPQEPTGADLPQQPADSTGRPPFQLKKYWWLLFPVVLVLWILVTRKSSETAPNLVAKSLEHAQAHRYAECLDAARQAAKLDPGLAEAYNNAGWCAGNLGQWDEAIRNTREALRLQPGLETAKNNLTWMLTQSSNANRTRPAATTPAEVALNLSLQHAEAHRYADCVDAAKSAIALNPGMAEAYNNLGFCYASLGKLDDGIQNIREALRLQPNFPLASNNLTMMLAEKAKTEGRGVAK